MNKQEKEELISFIEKEKENITLKHGKYSQTHFGFIWGTKLIEFIEQLDEPQKVKVPECVGELLDYYRNSTDVELWALLITFKDWYCRKDKAGEDENAIDWLVKHPEKYMRAWLDGYEVEEEPLYTVTINLDRKYHLVVDEGDDDEISTTLTTTSDVLGYRYFLTEKQIKAIDERYWPFAVPVEKV